MMQAQAQRNKYLETTVQTASPAQLLVMLYDGAIRFSKMAAEAINQRQMEEANLNLLKSQAIIREFMLTLDQTSSTADGLMKLYEYFLHRLTEANMKKETAPIEEVVGYLMELKETWIQAARQSKPATVVHP